MSEDAHDPALDVLDVLGAAADAAVEDVEQILERAPHSCDRRAAGASFRDIVPTETRPLIVELLRVIGAELAEAGSRWRRAEARALHAEGLGMEAVAALFGGTRQRVSSLLTPEAEPEGPVRAAAAIPVRDGGPR